MAKKSPTNKSNPKPLRLSDALILNRFLLDQFGLEKLPALAELLKESWMEGMDENNVSQFFHQLSNRPEGNVHLNKTQLLEYDQNIAAHTAAISKNRGGVVRWKYFQYLSLLFAEIYLDKYFRDRDGLLAELNAFVDRFNEPFVDGLPTKNTFLAAHFTENELRKVAFWKATGAGKTLVMHVNILQFRHYQAKYGTAGEGINRILLVTPNEGLSAQHLLEFSESGLDAVIFSKSAGIAFSGKQIEIIEMSKIREESGEKTIAVDAFETNNLVLIDEGHRGMDGEKWKPFRDQLSAKGFAFEYSATFGQAVSAATGSGKSKLVEEYGKSILFDYSYRYFYNDGYGKEFRIFNLKKDEKTEKGKDFSRKYLTGGLLAFFQQQLIFRENPVEARQFLIEKPLWVFVGSSVNAVRKVDKKDASDVVEIIRFFSGFVKNVAVSKADLDSFLGESDGIVDEKNNPVFKNTFTYLRSKNWAAAQLFEEILATVFNNNAAGANFYLNDLKSASGELGLRLGTGGDYFGVVNVGDEKTLHKLCKAEGILGEDDNFQPSLFADLNKPGSKVNLLIGSKKFTEGWSSWRVSSMGLMNIGKSEGAQIIQLFGRGVRLKGHAMSLKRSTKLDQWQWSAGKKPPFLPAMETLFVVGMDADYMAVFKQMLEDEGVSANDGQFREFKIPVKITVDLEAEKLKIIRFQDDGEFKKKVVVALADRKRWWEVAAPVVVDWRPKVQAMNSAATKKDVSSMSKAIPAPQKLAAQNLAFIDWNAVWLEIERFKNERSWHNLSIEKRDLEALFAEDAQAWYDLYLPSAELEMRSFRQVRLWQDVVEALLKNYVDRFYNYKKQEYLAQFPKVETLVREDANLEELEYSVSVDEGLTTVVGKMEGLMQKLDTAFGHELLNDNLGMFAAWQFSQHLYEPLLAIDSKKYGEKIVISPVALNVGEGQFLGDLKTFYEITPDFFEGKKLFLLRNKSRKGIGFFEANGFYPDFILWLVEGEMQRIIFIDPKGLRNVRGFSDPKIRFHKTIKAIEARMKEPGIVLDSHIVGTTKFDEVKHWAYPTDDVQVNISDFNAHHVWFMKEQQADYLKGIFAMS